MEWYGQNSCTHQHPHTGKACRFTNIFFFDLMSNFPLIHHTFMSLAPSFIRFMRQVITLKCCHPLITYQTPTVTLQGCVKVSISPRSKSNSGWAVFKLHNSTVQYVSLKALQPLDKHCLNGLYEWELETLINYWCNGRSHSWIHITHGGHAQHTQRLLNHMTMPVGAIFCKKRIQLSSKGMNRIK